MTVALSPEAAAAATGGQLLRRGPAQFRGVSTDSRSVAAGQVFVAIAGDRFDGHDYLAQAARAGAALLVVSREIDAAALPPSVGLLRVPDTRLALGALARAWRQQVAPAVVAITGSVGKTTTKELTRAVAAQLGPTHATGGNLNNDIGLPLTVLAMPEGTRTLVLEMGMNAPGEIAYLAGLAEPRIGCITAIAPVHLEGLGSIEAVAAAKAELLAGLPGGALAVVPGDEPLLAPHLRGLSPDRLVRFGSAPGDEARLVSVEPRGALGSRLQLSLRGGQPFAVELPLGGAHNARNACAAAAIGMLLGAAEAQIARALATTPELGHRSALRELGAWHVLDDCYNANPVAVRAALDTLRQLAAGKPALAVLGAMLELGSTSERLHREVGAHAAGCGLELLVTVGAQAAAIAEGARAAGLPAERVVEVGAPADAAALVAARAPAGAWVLIKASRGARLEGVLEGLRELKG
jgi:UDP-N-acetylmuramoyl-tripeptide--D-alanyl-D-alanine ligase